LVPENIVLIFSKQLKTTTVMSTLKFAEGVKGFTWDFESGEVVVIFTEELSAREKELVVKASGDRYPIFTEEDINNVFEGDWGSQEELEEAGMDNVLVFVD